MVLKINKIVHKYSNFELDISQMEIADNQIVGLIGSNGAGKTTLMNVLSRFLVASDAFDVSGLNEDKILYISSDLVPFDYMSVEEFVNIILKYSKSEKKCSTILDELQLQEKRNTQISDLSQGMTKKLSMVNIFINDYDLIILDEPFNSIDVNYIFQLKRLLLKLKKTTTIIISSHILDTLNDICDEYIYLKDGKVAKHMKNTGKIDELERELID
ncbi:ATP-binding cassette domain-containing protein [Streptococcus iniae]|nr:ATP-binding cassette domain-containing protein [Streptococcus iniae]RLU61961.1 ATP-binding cassette domain-containing protein [Streptococcus iniae]RLU70399.1 ATP-binding cassette domain-containing protein [Streptococcus iniae]RLU84371.1 ATP-binding cassette domain-containing protein [Streptococcus iniae]RLU84516.1 ATP-binding cassette domain-containing protein [Streptococcus iniae]